MADIVPIPEHKSLTPELLDLMEHEKVIEQGLATFIEVGNALLAIRDGKKYLHAGYGTFEDYCRQRWEFSRSRAHQLMDAAETTELVSTVVDKAESSTSIVQPRSEGQLRPLAKLRNEPEKAREAWNDAVDDAGGGQPTAKQVEKAVSRKVIKPDFGNGVSHPARYSSELMVVIRDLLDGFRDLEQWREHWRVLDPFAGTGRIHELRPDYETIGIEIEPEWANMHEDTIEGSALDLPFDYHHFDAIVTSPTYGNRLADHHTASDPESRRSYTHDLGRPLHPDNSGAMQWGDEYKRFHEQAWAEAERVLAPGGVMVLNIKDHVRDGLRRHVAGWHVTMLIRRGFMLLDQIPIDARHLRQGANSELRLTEWVYVLRLEL